MGKRRELTLAYAHAEGLERLREITYEKLLTTLEEVRTQQDYVTRLLDKHRAQTAQVVEGGGGERERKCVCVCVYVCGVCVCVRERERERMNRQGEG